MCVEQFKHPVYTNKYCAKKYKCGTAENTVCIFNCKLSSQCHQFVDYELTDEHRQYVLDIHNFYRNLVASGYETRGGHSKASNMMVLNYERDHEEVIHCWIRRCTYETDKCRSIASSVHNGQNMFRVERHAWWNDRFENGSVLIHRSITEWYEEVEHTNAKMVDSWSAKHNAQNVSQLLWANTVAVGCGYGKTAFTDEEDESNMISWHFFCNYNVGGNRKGEPMYLRGEPVTACPENTTAGTEYTSLCGELEIVSSHRQPMMLFVDGKEYKHEPANKKNSQLSVRRQHGSHGVSSADLVICNVIACSLSLINLF
ncbi:hypothetical protein Trydic_g23555 [Trypoxylus dichotomus]